MDNLAPVRTFFKELMTPIVENAIKKAIPDIVAAKNNSMMPISDVTKIYGISKSTIYMRFKTGELTKHKQDGLTFVDIEELEKTMKAEKLCDVAPQKQAGIQGKR